MEPGADELIDATTADPVARVRELTEGRGAEAVIAAIGHERANEQGMAMLSDRGRFVLFAAAHPEPDFSFAPNEMHNRETGVFGVVSKDKQDFYNLLDAWILKDKAPALEQQHFVVATLVRGGVFGDAG